MVGVENLYQGLAMAQQEWGLSAPPAPSTSRCQRKTQARIPTSRKIAVIGGGWAGCAAAIELSRLGTSVMLFEAARTLGGRARLVEVDGRLLDNGQHILLGAYSETLRLMRLIGIDPNDVLRRLPLQMRYPNGTGMNFIAARLPAPLHMLVGLLRADGLKIEDKLALARFSTAARWMNWQLYTDCSVAELLMRFDQTDRLVRLMWRPLCIAALNTPPERASAQIFLNVLRDSLGARSATASDMLLPRIDLTALFPQRAAEFIERHGGQLRLGTSINDIQREEDGWRLGILGTSANETFEAVVVATQPRHAAALLNGFVNTTWATALGHESITTCYLQYNPELTLPQPLYALFDDATLGHWGQFVFDRGQLDHTNAGLLSVVISASDEAIAQGHEALVASLTKQLAEAFRNPALAQPKWVKVISEKRATFSCTPALVRPPNSTGCEGLVIAGDYTACDYPATLEAAVRSGLQAAHYLMR